MFAIKINGEFLELSKNTSLSLKNNNPIFGEGVIPGDFSLTFNLVNTKKNREILNFPDIIENTHDFRRDQEAELFLGGGFWKYCLLTILTVKNSIINCKLRSSVSHYVGTTADKSLREIDYGGDQVIDEAYPYILTPVAILNYDLGDDITVDINSGAFNYNEPYNGDGTIETTLENLCNQVNVDSETHSYIASWTKTTFITPYNRILYYLFIKSDTLYTHETDVLALTLSGTDGLEFYTQIRNHYGASINFDYAIKNKAKYLLDNEHLYELYFGRKFCFPTIYNLETFSWSGVDFQAIYNNYRTAQDDYLDSSYYNFMVPQIYISYILSKVFEDAGYRLVESIFEEDEDLSTLFFYNNFSLEQYEGSAKQYKGSLINIKNHVPDITARDFLLGLTGLGIGFFFDPIKREVVIKKIKDIILEPDYEDITGKASPYSDLKILDPYGGYKFSYEFSGDDALPSDRVQNMDQYNLVGELDHVGDLPGTGDEYGDVYRIRDINKYYIWTNQNPPTADSWELLGENLEEYIEGGEGTTSRTLTFAPLCIDKDFDFNGGTINRLAPVVSHNITSIFLNTTNHDFGARLCFFRGFDEDEGYPLATYDLYNYNFDEIGGLSLRLEGEKSLIYLNWKNLLLFWENTRKLITFPLSFATFGDVRAFDFTGKKRIDRTDYLIKTLEIKISLEGIDNIQAEAYPVRRYVPGPYESRYPGSESGSSAPGG